MNTPTKVTDKTVLLQQITTFSSHEALSLLRQNQYTIFGLYIILSILPGIAWAFTGAWAGNLYSTCK